MILQMIMLEPSSQTPLNIESCSYYCSDSKTFESYVQHTLHGCCINGASLPNMFDLECLNCCGDDSLSSISTSPGKSFYKSDCDATIRTDSTVKHSSPKRKRSMHSECNIEENMNDNSSFVMHASSLWDDSNDSFDMRNSTQFEDDGISHVILQSFKRMKYEEENS